MWAAANRHDDVVRFLCAQARVNTDHASAGQGCTAVYWAAAHNHASTIAVLASAGARSVRCCVRGPSR